MIATTLLAILSLFSTAVLADLRCRQFVPHGRKSNLGLLNFIGESNGRYVPSTNASVGHEVYLPSPQEPGTIFHFETCNSTSLNFSTSAVTDDCVDVECQKYYYHNVRVINPASGHCLTSRPAKNGLLALTPELCDSSPTTTAQIFQTLQYVFWTLEYGHIIGYGQVNFLPCGYIVNYDQSLNPWQIGSDNKTLFYNPPSIGVSLDSLFGNIVF